MACEDYPMLKAQMQRKPKPKKKGPGPMDAVAADAAANMKGPSAAEKQYASKKKGH